MIATLTWAARPMVSCAAYQGGGVYTINDFGGTVTGITTIGGSAFSMDTPDAISGDFMDGGGDMF
jgi:hypothetical protein